MVREMRQTMKADNLETYISAKSLKKRRRHWELPIEEAQKLPSPRFSRYDGMYFPVPAIISKAYLCIYTRTDKAMPVCTFSACDDACFLHLEQSFPNYEVQTKSREGVKDLLAILLK